MIYSVWDYARRVYDYYDSPNKRLDSASSAPAPKLSAGPLGATPEKAAWSLPSDAKPIGSGKYPRGMIATRKGALSGLSGIFDPTADNVLVLGILGYFVWRYVLGGHRG